MIEVRARTRSQLTLHKQIKRGVVTRWNREVNIHHANYVETFTSKFNTYVGFVCARGSRHTGTDKSLAINTHDIQYERFGRELSFISWSCWAKKLELTNYIYFQLMPYWW